MSIAKFAALLGQNVLIVSEDDGFSVQGQLVTVNAVNDTTHAFVVRAFGQTIAVELTEGGNWSIEDGSKAVGNPPAEPEVDSLDGILSHEGYGGEVSLRPTGWEDFTMKWELYIPPTQPEHFDVEGNAVEPWGSTYWSSLTAALASLNIAVKKGDVKFNDGRSAS